MQRREILKGMALGAALPWADLNASGYSGSTLGLIALTDRLPQDFAEMVQWASTNKLDGLDIGRVWGKSAEELFSRRDELKGALAGSGLKAPSISTTLFKCPLESEEFTRQRQHLDICFDLARHLGAGTVAASAFARRGYLDQQWTKLVERFREMANAARAKGIVLGVVNDPETLLGTGRDLARLVEAIGSPNLKAVWDPCAAIYEMDRPEIPFPDGYERVQPYLAIVRLRDVDRQMHSGNLQECALGDGLVNWHGLIKALIKDRFQGALDIATNWYPGVAPSRGNGFYQGDSSPQGAQKASETFVQKMRALSLPVESGARPASVSEFARTELAGYLHKISGQVMPISGGRLPGDAHYLYVHTKREPLAPARQSQLAAQLKGLPAEGFLIQSMDQGLAIAAPDQAGLVFGSYAFLKRLGARWYFPGAEGEFLPKLGRLPLEGHDVKSAPSFSSRGIIARVTMDNFRDWVDLAPKIGLNEITIHSQEGLMELPRVAGNRGLHLGMSRHFFGHEFCSDDERRLRWEETRVKGYLKLVPPEFEDVGLATADGFNELCGTHSLGDQLMRFDNRMSRAAREIRPDMQWGYGVYHSNWMQPPKVAPAPGVRIGMAPIHRCYNHAVDDPKCGINAPYRYSKPIMQQDYGIRPVIEEFAGKYGGNRLSIIEYWIDASLFGRHIFTTWKNRLPQNGSIMQADLHFYHRLGVRKISSFNLDIERKYLERYTSPLISQYGAVLWDVNADLESELRLFCANWFGSEDARRIFGLDEPSDPKDLTPDECTQLSGGYEKKIVILREILAGTKNERHQARLNRMIREYEHCAAVMQKYARLVPLQQRPGERKT